MNKEFNELKEKLAEKYHDQIDLIIKVKGVDAGVALDILITFEINGTGCPYINHEEFMKDYEELLNAAKKC